MTSRTLQKAENQPNEASPPEVLVLLSTFNGAAFLREQIESILGQTFTDWQLLIRDDRSTDATPEILRDFAGKDGRIQIVQEERGRSAGAGGSFALLMELAMGKGGRFVCFCDQDDVWHPEKIERAVAEARRIESRVGGDVPVLVYSDLTVVDRELQEIAPSFYAYQGIRAAGEPSCFTLLVQNHVVGCSTLFNRALLEFATPVPQEAYMHDWWVAICARVRGAVSFLDAPLVSYRQHEGNSAGAAGIRRLRRRADWGRVWRKMNRIFFASIAQAASLDARLRERGDVVEEPARSAVRSWGRIGGKGFLERAALAARWRLKSQSLPLTVLLYVQLLLFPLVKVLFRPAQPETNPSAAYSGPAPL